jgi:hypothetical protein
MDITTNLSKLILTINSLQPEHKGNISVQKDIMAIICNLPIEAQANPKFIELKNAYNSLPNVLDYDTHNNLIRNIALSFYDE